MDVVVEGQRRIEHDTKYIQPLQHCYWTYGTATQMGDGRPSFRRPGLVPQNASSDLIWLRKRSLLQNNYCSAVVQ